MDNNLDILHIIDTKQLDQRDYTRSLLDQALQCNLISKIEFDRIISEIRSLLEDQTNALYGDEFFGFSQAVQTDFMTSITTSILFLISIELKSCISPEYAVEMLKTKSLKSIFEKGKIKTQRKKTSGFIVI